MAPLTRELRELAEADAKNNSADDIAMAESFSYLMQLAIQAAWAPSLGNVSVSSNAGAEPEASQDGRLVQCRCLAGLPGQGTVYNDV